MLIRLSYIRHLVKGNRSDEHTVTDRLILMSIKHSVSNAYMSETLELYGDMITKVAS